MTWNIREQLFESRKLLLLILFIVSFQTSAQISWPIVRINENFSVRMPSNHILLDTMGLIVHRAESDLGIVGVMKVDRGSVNIRDKQALIRDYDGFQKGMLTQMGKFHTDTTYELNGFQVRQFTTTVPDQAFAKRQVVVLLAHGATMYAFTYVFNNYQRTQALKEMEYFYSSITPAEGVTPEGQLGVTDDFAFGEALGKVLFWLVAAATLLAVVFWFTGKQRYVLFVKKAIAATFLCISALQMFVFAGNLIMERAYYQFVVVGTITGLAGLALLFWKLPERVRKEGPDS